VSTYKLLEHKTKLVMSATAEPPTTAAAETETSAELNVWGVVGIAVFYLLIVLVGVWAAWYKRNKNRSSDASETIIVGGRDIGLFVGCFTMTATWVGGGYINGTSELVYSGGLLFTQAPWGYALSLVLGGLLFAKQMRVRGFVTMLDPIQRKLGDNMGALLYLPALLAELFWSAAILSALGSSLRVIVGLERTISVIVSAVIAVGYTLVGGLYSVAYTDVVQLICIFLGLWLSIPFALINDKVDSIAITPDTSGWLGTWSTPYTGGWIDSALLLIFGGIPWQVYFQRVLSAKSAKQAQQLSFVAAFGCIFMAVPPVIIGAIGYSTRWNETALGTSSVPPADVLPLVLHHLTPTAVGVIGLGAVSAAVMSSADSSILSVSSMFLQNVYRKVFRCGKAGATELKWVLRVVIVIMGAAACVFALLIESVYTLWYLCSDLLYVILFPQLLCTFYMDPNTYGSLMAFAVGLVLRIGGGEQQLNFHPFIPYPGNEDIMEGKYNFPYKTLAMVSSLVTTIVASWIAKMLFTSGILSPKYDIFNCNLAYGGRSIDIKQNKEDEEPPIPITDIAPPAGRDNTAFDPPPYEEKTAL